MIGNRDEQIQHMAHYDMLTDLPNRVLLNKKLSIVLKESNLNNRIALLYLDLDNFKTVNDTLGHNYGDILKIDKDFVSGITESKRQEDIESLLKSSKTFEVM